VAVDVGVAESVEVGVGVDVLGGVNVGLAVGVSDGNTATVGMVSFVVFRHEEKCKPSPITKAATAAPRTRTIIRNLIREILAYFHTPRIGLCLLCYNFRSVCKILWRERMMSDKTLVLTLPEDLLDRAQTAQLDLRKVLIDALEQKLPPTPDVIKPTSE
jgi:hypothetical protein